MKWGTPSRGAGRTEVLGTPSILVVEDDDALRSLIVASLAGHGHRLEGVSSGPEVLERIVRPPKVDLLILDLMLGSMSGWDVLNELERMGLRSELRVLVLTALGSEQDIHEGWRRGVDLYLAKPFDPTALLEGVREVLLSAPERTAERREEEIRKTQLFNFIDRVFDED